MRDVNFDIVGLSPYSQSRQVAEPRGQGEIPEDWERRTWRQKLHVQDGKVYIPPMAIKSAIVEASRFLSIKIPNKRNATYTKHFEAGLLATELVDLGVLAEEVEGEWLSLSPTGRKGGMGVMKCFPKLDTWKGHVHLLILDDTITKDIFEKHLTAAGQFIGLGRFRPRNGGFYGRFRFENLIVEDME